MKYGAEGGVEVPAIVEAYKHVAMFQTDACTTLTSCCRDDPIDAAQIELHISCTPLVAARHMLHINLNFGVAVAVSTSFGHIVEIELWVVHGPCVDARFDDCAQIGTGYPTHTD